jgi:hypothetical protein
MFLIDADITTELKNLLQQPGGLTGTFWTALITSSHTAAYGEIRRRLTARGYSAAQIAAWDDGAEFELAISIFWCLKKGQGKDDENAKSATPYDRRLELNTVQVTINGIWTPPANALVITTGEMDTSEDLFALDPADPRIGDPEGAQF